MPRAIASRPPSSRRIAASCAFEMNSSSTSTPGYLGTDYLNDGNTAKGTKTFSFKPVISTAADYLVYARWPAGTGSFMPRIGPPSSRG